MIWVPYLAIGFAEITLGIHALFAGVASIFTLFDRDTELSDTYRCIAIMVVCAAMAAGLQHILQVLP